MTKNTKDDIMNIYLKEFEFLKLEQNNRIGFRDNLIYVNFFLIGGIISFALSKENYIALFLIPLVCSVLGWTYLVNDEKISSIGRYLRNQLLTKLQELINIEDEGMLGWEFAHRSDKRRIRRKILQFIFDELTFFSPGIFSIVIYYLLVPKQELFYILISIFECIVLVIIAVEIFIYADFQKSD